MSDAVLIRNVRIVTPAANWERGWLFFRQKRIALMGHGEAPSIPDAAVIDAEGLILLPGFIDVHAHGGAGHEIMDATPEAVRAVSRFYAQHGVTGFLPTTWTDARDNIMRALEVVAELQGPQPDGATVLGAHLEGPYLNIAKCGAQATQYIRTADYDEALAFLDLGVIRLVALAPEFAENHWLIEECVRRGVTVSAAHTAASYAEIRHAVELGLTQSTHTYNAQGGLGHREPGTVGGVLTSPEVYCELIADNIHVHPAAMRILYAAKGLDHVILITDAVRGAGMSDAEYTVNDRKVVVKDGAVRLADGTLAGSTLTMDRALRNFMDATGLPLEKAWPASSLNAARSIHIADRKGSLEVGKDADLVLVDEQISVYMTIAEGQIVYRQMI